MHDGPRYEPLEGSTFFGDGRSARTPVANTVARGMLRQDEHLYNGTINGQLTDTFPMPVTPGMMARGHERFNVFCSPCHGRTGQGNGMVVQRGFRAPASFHDARLRNAPVGYYVNVETNGFGAMSDYTAQVPAADRWAIAAYIRALQFSQNATVDDVPADRRAELDEPAAAEPGAAPAQEAR
ncbi:MAG: cytochrome c [Acidobacteria bacterium]|nr:cytochrome c [Acidobacteriota bacterium]